jgi:hypothetical protein
MHWRCSIAPVSNILVAHGARLADWDGPAFHYSSGGAGRFFESDDLSHLTPSRLADEFVRRLPDLVALGRGRDWLYVGWYVEMLSLTHPYRCPIAYADMMDDSLAYLPTVGPDDSAEVCVPLPPPGEVGRGR